MKRHTWNLGKNTKLKLERGVSFEEVFMRILSGAFRVAKNPSRSHRGQRMYVITIHGRKYVVPFTEHDDHIFLRTIYEVET